MRPPGDQLEASANQAAEEAERAVLDGSAALTAAPEEPAAMDIDSSAPCPSISDVQIHPAHAKLQHSSIAAPFYVARTQPVMQGCYKSKPERQPSRYLSTHRASMAATEVARQPNGNVEHEESTETGAKCLVCVSLQTVGPGVLHEGAAILSLSAEEAASIRRSMLGHKLLSKVLTLLYVLYPMC